MATKKRVTSAVRVKNAMEQTVLHNTFVLQAIAYYSKVVLQDEAKTIADMKNHIISGEAWVQVAKDMDSMLKED